MSLDEAYIVLGVEGGAQHDDSAIMIAYDELVDYLRAQSERRLMFNRRERRNSRKQWR